ncbi:DUF4810 domain-containing protein [Pelistega sp. NLN82]|uniref:DUF4810 domain-containing protein n=1 Tax=Pelistega ratti TaxID=2652177 RepID=A0A6L9Y4C8_9BURK|nr:DUF4810 domain-containing protein [Pelistega ratti]NEN75279.1 DUF4810 domain-containing protein [Pelistega ratti]
MKKLWLLPLILSLAACASGPENLYSWGTYPSDMYKGMQSELSPDEQIGRLEKYIEQTTSGGKNVAPGAYAQLGLLYSEIGKQELARSAFLKEQELFPESAQFMSFLLKDKAKMDTPTEDKPVAKKVSAKTKKKGGAKK